MGPFLEQKIFNSIHSETEMMRYIHTLQLKDLALDKSMISLGSCTMKLNSVSSLAPCSWPEIANIHPFAPASNTKGYVEMLESLEAYLVSCTGFAACSLQPTSGASGLGPICVRAHLAPHLPNHGIVSPSSGGTLGAVSAAPWGQAGIACIPWMFCTMLGPKGITDSARYAILNANYLKARLEPHYQIIATNANNKCSHEFIIDCSRSAERVHHSSICTWYKSSLSCYVWYDDQVD